MSTRLANLCVHVIPSSNVKFLNNSANSGGGLSTIAGDREVFINNCIFNGNFVDIGGGSGGGAIYSKGGVVKKFINQCTFIQNSGSGSVFKADHGDSTIFTNSIFYDNDGTEIYIERVDENTDEIYVGIQYSLTDFEFDSMYVSTGSTLENLGGNIDIDPMFADTANGNYHLLASSQLINAGHPDSTDSDGSRADIGAYPYLNSYSGPTWYITEDGNDTTATGATDDPFRSIQAGINFSSDADSVTVAAGTYVENINFRGRNIAVVGADRETTIIDGNQSGPVVTLEAEDHNYTGIIKNLSIYNGSGIEHSSTRLKGGGGVFVRNDEHIATAIIDNCIITGNDLNGSGKGSAVFFDFGSYGIIRNSILKENINLSEGVIFSWSDYLIENTLITQNTSRVVFQHSSWSPSTPIVNQVTITNNFVPAGETDGYILGTQFDSQFDFRNTNIVDNEQQGLYIFGDSIGYNPSLSVNYCNADYPNVDGTGNIDVDPMFVDTANGNYNLLASSQLINGGHPDSLDSDGSRADIGAYPYLNNYSGPIWYITEGGNDTTATGASDDPFRSIQSGINFSNSGDTVLVAAGQYTENINWS
jgi:hypothetical protein